MQCNTSNYGIIIFLYCRNLRRDEARDLSGQIDLDDFLNP